MGKRFEDFKEKHIVTEMEEIPKTDEEVESAARGCFACVIGCALFVLMLVKCSGG